MRVHTKRIKESKMIVAAEDVFFELGYNNTRMEDIAKEAECSKTTLYSYFESKENLYMAITYRAFQALMDNYYTSLKNSSDETGLEKVLHFYSAYISFSEKNYKYQQLLIEYVSFLRSLSGKGQEQMLNEQLSESIWFQRVRDIHDFAQTKVVPLIKEGQSDGSITSKVQPEELYLTIYALLIGYTKLIYPADAKRKMLFHVNLDDWKKSIRELIKNILLI